MIQVAVHRFLDEGRKRMQDQVRMSPKSQPTHSNLGVLRGLLRGSWGVLGGSWGGLGGVLEGS